MWTLNSLWICWNCQSSRIPAWTLMDVNESRIKNSNEPFRTRPCRTEGVSRVRPIWETWWYRPAPQDEHITVYMLSVCSERLQAAQWESELQQVMLAILPTLSISQSCLLFAIACEYVLVRPRLWSQLSSGASVSGFTPSLSEFVSTRESCAAG